MQAMSFANTALEVANLPTRHPYTLGLSQGHIERILRGWVEELGVPIQRGLEVTGFVQDAAGVDVHLEGRRRGARPTWWVPMAGAASSAGQPASSSSVRRRPAAT